MKEILFEERKEIAFQILVYVKQICEQNKIPYSLCGGTLIGAIRHKGFIPWDDDIDIFLLREHYNKLLNILKKDSKYALYMPGETKNYIYGHSKLVDTRTILKNDYEKAIGMPEMGIFIDIFPIDFIPYEHVNGYYKKIKKYMYNALRATEIGYYYSPKKYKAMVKKFLYYPKHILCKRVGTEYWMKLAEKEATRYFKEGAEFCGSPYSTYGSIEVLPREIYETTIQVEFEEISFSVIKEYDKFLRKVYGDYMKLPPEDKRVIPHEYEAFWRE